MYLPSCLGALLCGNVLFTNVRWRIELCRFDFCFCSEHIVFCSSMCARPSMCGLEYGPYGSIPIARGLSIISLSVSVISIQAQRYTLKSLKFSWIYFERGLLRPLPVSSTTEISFPSRRPGLSIILKRRLIGLNVSSTHSNPVAQYWVSAVPFYCSSQKKCSTHKTYRKLEYTGFLQTACFLLSGNHSSIFKLAWRQCSNKTTYN